MSVGQLSGDWRLWPPKAKARLLERLKQERPEQGSAWPSGWLPRNDGKLYFPNAGQTAFHASPARFRALVGGRGSGKTTAGAQEALGRIGRGLDGLVLSPSIPHFNTSTREEFWKWIPWEQVTQHHRTEKWMRFDTGATVYYGGIEDEDRWRGPNVNWLWFDESARKGTDLAWKVAVAGVRIGPNPQAWTTTTPRGRRHWLYKMFVEQEIPPEVEALLAELGHEGPLYEYFHASIHDNRANLDPLFYVSMLTAYTGSFREQELNGQFVETAEGLVYEEFGPENITTAAEFEPGRGPVEVAYDDGFAASPRVFLLIQRGDNGEVFVFDEIYHTRHLPGVCIEEAKDMLKEHVRVAARRLEDARERAALLADAEAGNGLARFEIAVGDPSAVELQASWRQADVVARGGRCEIIEGIKRLRALVRDGSGMCRLQIHPRCKNLLREMGEDYKYPEGSEAKAGIKPLKEHDHGPDALRYWAWLRTRPAG
jgi:hypothetical protein